MRYDNNPFIRRLYSGEKVVIAELDPPHDANDGKMLEAAAVLKEAGVEMNHVLRLPDGADAGRLRHVGRESGEPPAD